jgi:hypothetical protein
MKELKVHFLPNGGFDKNGAFVEYREALTLPDENKVEYQRQGYLTIDLLCEDIALNASFGIVNEEAEAAGRGKKRSISAKGRIQPARWGKFSLSLLGENTTTEEVNVWIHETAETEQVWFGGASLDADLYHEGFNGFIVELHLATPRFERLIEDLSAPNSQLQIQVRADRFPNFYSEWSPSISEGRVVKFLQSKRDIENSNEVPEIFWREPDFQRELTSDPERPPITVSVNRYLQSEVKFIAEVDEKHEDVSRTEESELSYHARIAPINYKPDLDDISTILSRGILWICLLLALILLAVF